jgi:hypothetical protein
VYARNSTQKVIADQRHLNVSTDHVMMVTAFGTVSNRAAQML